MTLCVDFNDFQVYAGLFQRNFASYTDQYGFIHLKNGF